MPFLSFMTPKKRRTDRGALMVYIIIVIVILTAASFAGGSIALSGRSNNHASAPAKVVIDRNAFNTIGK